MALVLVNVVLNAINGQHGSLPTNISIEEIRPITLDAGFALRHETVIIALGLKTIGGLKIARKELLHVSRNALYAHYLIDQKLVIVHHEAILWEYVLCTDLYNCILGLVESSND